MAQKGDLLLGEIAETGDDSPAMALLDEFFTGYPVSELRRLLRSEDERVVKIAAWIASELGADAKEMIGDVASLLSHSSRAVRFHAVDFLFPAGDEFHGKELAAAVERISDYDRGVRWMAMRLLTRLSLAEILASLPNIGRADLQESARWLAEVERSRNLADITAALNRRDSLDRRFAVVAAARLARWNSAPLEQAAALDDDEIATFATQELDALRDGPP